MVGQDNYINNTSYLVIKTKLYLSTYFFNNQGIAHAINELKMTIERKGDYFDVIAPVLFLQKLGHMFKRIPLVTHKLATLKTVAQISQLSHLH